MIQTVIRYGTHLALVIAMASAGGTVKAEAMSLPHVVIILADDMGYGDPGCYNRASKIATPHLDALASHGFRFTDAHTPSSVCTPTRYGLMTGRYCWRTRLTQSVLDGFSPPLIEAGRWTIASMLKSKGYRTACLGKWHLGMQWRRHDGSLETADRGTGGFRSGEDLDFNLPLSGGPRDVGFDQFFGIAASLDMPPYCWIENDRCRPAPDILTEDHRQEMFRTQSPGKGHRDFRIQDVLPTLKQRTIQTIDEHFANHGDRPLFLYLPLTSPHLPVAPSDAFVGRSQVGLYGDFVMETDDFVGNVVARFEKHDALQNTLILFTSDNGGLWHRWEARETDDIQGYRPTPRGEHTARFGHHSNGLLRGTKADIYEGGHRVPFLMQWPRMIPAGKVIDDPIELTDVFATVADIVGLKIPDSVEHDSCSFAELFGGTRRNSPQRQALVHHSIQGLFAIRVGDWKFIEARGSGGFSSPRTVKAKEGEATSQLYHLRSDPYETDNVVMKHPETAAQLSRLLDSIRQSRTISEVFANPSRLPVSFPSEEAIMKSDSKTEKGGVWDIDKLKQVPTMRWLNQQGAVHSLLFEGEPYLGKGTEVFAFYASPVTLGEAEPSQKLPGVVLIHGGGGTAFAEWVWMWAKRGYAAIAMDLGGNQPVGLTYDDAGLPVSGQHSKPESRTRLPQGGPPQEVENRYDSIGGDVSDDWPYHAVASVIRAHSLLRSLPEVDPERTAVTGISWGGYTTCMVASLDDRFRAAVPVYGSGFYFDGESVQRNSLLRLGDRAKDWIRLYDPSSHLGRCRVPIFFVNGAHDIHNPLDTWQKSYDLVPGIKRMRADVSMRHSHPAGWAPSEIGWFIDAYCRGGQPLPEPGKWERQGDEIRLFYTSAIPLRTAELHYTQDTGLRSERRWQQLAGRIEQESVVCPAPPATANTWFIAITDDRDAMVSTPVQFAP